MSEKTKPINTVYMNRELSWLKFNERVLEEAADVNVPLFEQLRFVGIFMSNLDEFFMIRVGSLQDQALLREAPADNKTGLSPKQQIQAVLKCLRRDIVRKDTLYRASLKALGKHGIRHLRVSDLSESDKDFAHHYYMREIYPLLSPQIIDNRHPFPFLMNRRIYVGVYFDSAHATGFGVIPASGAFNRLVMLPGPGLRFVLAEDLIYHYADTLFGGNKPSDKAIFRVTRNADIITDSAMFDEDVDFRFTMKELLKKRVKLAPVRLEVMGGDKKDLIRYLCKKLGLAQNRVFANKSPLDLSHIFDIERLLTPAMQKKLLFSPLKPQEPASVRECSRILDCVLERDLLFSYPYESMKPFIRLLDEAAQDPLVVSIRISLYRVAKQSEIVHSLIAAAENGKDVIVVVELRARFDEEHNIEWATRLTEAGCRVIYGVEACKVHCKLLLITRRTDKSIQYITQIGTGNYNERTARLYTDLSLMTADPDIGLDAVSLFNDILVNNLQGSYSHLLVAPARLRDAVLEKIDAEIAHAADGRPAAVTAKLNSMTDKRIIDKLIEASQAGVTVRLMIRGICCLLPGVPGKTDNITVVSIVGRFLEHSRVYCFGAGERREVYIASADWMTRNTERRIEVACPILDPALAARIVDMLELGFADNVKARRLCADGAYERRALADGEQPLNSQLHQYALAYRAAGREFPV
jgi:polyphosphate kinase